MAKRIKPCFECGSKNIIIRDCNYSSFNCGYVECSKCGLKHESSCGIMDDAEKDLIKSWNSRMTNLEKSAKTKEEKKRAIKSIRDFKKDHKLPVKNVLEGGGPGYDDHGKWVVQDANGHKIYINDVYEILKSLPIMEKHLK